MRTGTLISANLDLYNWASVDRPRASINNPREEQAPPERDPPALPSPHLRGWAVLQRDVPALQCLQEECLDLTPDF